MAHLRKPLVLALALNTVALTVETIGSVEAKSLSLAMDTIHNRSDELFRLWVTHSGPIQSSRSGWRSLNLALFIVVDMSRIATRAPVPLGRNASPSSRITGLTSRHSSPFTR